MRCCCRASRQPTEKANRTINIITCSDAGLPANSVVVSSAGSVGRKRWSLAEWGGSPLPRFYRTDCLPSLHPPQPTTNPLQVIVLEILGRYAREHFSDPNPGRAAVVQLQAKQRSSSALLGGRIGQTIKRKFVKKAFYSDEEDETVEEEVEVTPNASGGMGALSAPGGAAGDAHGAGQDEIDPDHRLLLKSSLPLLRSRNAGTCVCVCVCVSAALCLRYLHGLFAPLHTHKLLILMDSQFHPHRASQNSRHGV
jgi:hypothetical protein